MKNPALQCKSAKQERFCQLLAAGGGVKKSYLTAGYANGRHAAQNANTLKNDLRPRIRFLEEQRATNEAEATREAVKARAITVQWYFERLRANVEMLVKERPVFRRGRPTGEWRYDGRAVNKALELAGKALGMFLASDDPLERERHEHMTEAERIAENRRLTAEARHARNQLRLTRLRSRVANDNWQTGRTAHDDQSTGVARNSETSPDQGGGSDTGAGRARPR
jgi:hypothetical protein